MPNPFPPRQRGYRYPKHSGFGTITTAGLQDVVAAVPILRGESLRHVHVDWWMADTGNDDLGEPINMLMYGIYFPYTFAIGGVSLTEANIEEMVAEHFHDPLQNYGGDPGGAAGESDQEDWVGEDEAVSGIEVIFKRWATLKPYQVIEKTGPVDTFYHRDAGKTSIRKDRYFGADGFIAWGFQWLPNPQDDDLLGIEVLDASIGTPTTILEAIVSGAPADEDASNQVRELIYGGDAKGAQADSTGDVDCMLLLDHAIATPYPLPGSEFR